MTSLTVNETAGVDPRIALLKELSDPLRLRVVDRLGHAGPATVSRLAAELGVPLPQLSNHLRRLRDAGLVSVRREGRQAVYALADPGLQQLLPLLDSITGRVLDQAGRDQPRRRVASRSCYEHLGGEIGVAIYAALRDRDAVRPRADGTVELGPTAGETFAALGFDVDAVAPGRQRLAFECLDATEHAPHLAGALADAMAAALVRRRWISRKPDSRVIALTPSGARGLRGTLGLELSAA
jgi:DNA-binding transcriptional ArsR family regulator